MMRTTAMAMAMARGGGGGKRMMARMGMASRLLSSSASSAAASSSASSTPRAPVQAKRTIPDDGLTLAHFLVADANHDHTHTHTHTHAQDTHTSSPIPEPVIGVDADPVRLYSQHQYGHVHTSSPCSSSSSSHPTLSPEPPATTTAASTTPPLLHGRTYFIETYGCQMNTNDTEIVQSIVESAGMQRVDDVTNADVVLVNTCAVRENAEQKVWSRLDYFKTLKAPARTKHLERRAPVVGVLGCMAERLKEKLLESNKKVDFVVGPDAYRDLPRLLSVVDGGAKAVNVQLSLDETYADVAPVRLAENRVSAFVSIMRGCDNMCSYCIVPFTRGRERSRDVDSIVREVQDLSDKGYKEVTLLGQNVNSYNFASERKLAGTKDAQSRGFVNISKRPLTGVGFTELMDRVSLVNPEMRIRFTSPHPKDFPDDLLHLIKERPNLCKQIHIPAQSGSTEVLARMRRGYSRESYLALVTLMRSIIPNVALSTDMISGFCGETEQDHEDTLRLMREVQYDQAFMFAYSQRERTHAHRAYPDDVPEETKLRRLKEVIDTFQSIATEKNKREVGNVHLVLVDGLSRKSDEHLSGRADSNRKIIFPLTTLPVVEWSPSGASPTTQARALTSRTPQIGDYVMVHVTSTSSLTYIGQPLGICTLQDFHRMRVAHSSVNASAASVASSSLGMPPISFSAFLDLALGRASSAASTGDRMTSMRASDVA